jgi:hypothetical protein
MDKNSPYNDLRRYLAEILFFSLLSSGCDTVLFFNKFCMPYINSSDQCESIYIILYQNSLNIRNKQELYKQKKDRRGAYLLLNLKT